MPSSGEQHAAYAEETRRLCWQGARTACILAVTLVPVFAVLDAVVFPREAIFFLELRVACTVGGAVLLWLLYRPFGRQHALGIGVALAIGVGLAIDVMTFTTGPGTSPYYAGVSLILLVVALLMPWPPRWSLLVSLVLVGGYAAPVLLGAMRGVPIDGRLLANNLFFLLSTALIAVVSSVLRERLRRQEFDTRTALVEALRHKSDFLAHMSHELRTPIHVMIGYADILLEDDFEGDAAGAQRLLERIRGHGLLLHDLITDLLDYAKIEAGKMEVHPEPIRVRDLVESIADRFRPITVRKGLDLETICRDELPEVVSDRQRVTQILTNLVGNAVKFTDRGAITIEARVAQNSENGFTSLTRSENGHAASEQVVILVRDTGIGIRDEDMARLSAEFVQVDREAAAKYGGTGLGLSISRRLAERLGGRIAVRSRYRKGSTFALFLPLAE